MSILDFPRFSQLAAKSFKKTVDIFSSLTIAGICILVGAAHKDELPTVR